MQSTDSVNEIFDQFINQVNQVLTEPTAVQSKDLYKTIGRSWAQTRRDIEALEKDGHLPADDRTVSEDIEDAVMGTVAALWVQAEPTIGGKKVPLRGTSIQAAYKEAYSGALAHAASAADRAAAASIPTSVPLTPPREVLPNANAEPTQGKPDLIDVLLSRMPGAGGEPPSVPKEATEPSGNVDGTTGRRAAAVDPSLARACRRLTDVGCPPLRVDKVGSSLAMHILMAKDTFTAYVENRGLTGGQYREVMTLARALDLGTVEFGCRYLTSSTAEVQLRRLVSLLLGVKMGNFRLASFLEEVPGDTALDVLPEVVMKSLAERLKLEMKIESLAKDK